MGAKFAVIPYELGLNRDREKSFSKNAHERWSYLIGTYIGEG